MPDVFRMRRTCNATDEEMRCLQDIACAISALEAVKNRVRRTKFTRAYEDVHRLAVGLTSLHKFLDQINSTESEGHR
jgi:hypothetical protein